MNADSRLLFRFNFHMCTDTTHTMWGQGIRRTGDNMLWLFMYQTGRERRGFFTSSHGISLWTCVWHNVTACTISASTTGKLVDTPLNKAYWTGSWSDSNARCSSESMITITRVPASTDWHRWMSEWDLILLLSLVCWTILSTDFSINSIPI